MLSNVFGLLRLKVLFDNADKLLLLTYHRLSALTVPCSTTLNLQSFLQNAIIIIIIIIITISSTAAQCGLWPPRPRGFLITHNDAPQSVGLLWTSDQLVAEISAWLHTTDKHPCPGGIRTHDRSRRATEDLSLRPRGHWDRLQKAIQ
jgi:hypothetical protein